MPAKEKPERKREFVAPRTPIEEALVKIWEEVLRIKPVGVNDNFFQLAGESISAMQLLSRVHQATQVELSLLDFTQQPTVAGMVLAIMQHKKEKLEGQGLLPKIVPTTENRYLPFPLTDMQQAYWVGRNEFFEGGNVACHIYTEVQFDDLDLERLNLAWQRLINRHEMLRAVVLPVGQQQILAEVPPYEIEVLDLRGQSPQEVESQLETVRQSLSHQVLKTDQWPLFEIRASRLGDQAFRLHISLDLLIADVLSLEIINRELSQLYQNPDTPLTPLELSFRDYVLAEVAIQNSESYQGALDYWRNRLATLPSAPELSLQKNLGSISQPRFTRLSARLDPVNWLRLKNRSTQAGLTPAGILLAAFAEVLKVWSEKPQFTLNLTLFNRLPLHPQVNDIVGDFTSSILLEVDDSTQDTFEARAQRLQEQLWKDLDHRCVGGIQVLRELSRIQDRASGAVMPIAFTSTLTQGTLGQDLFTLGGLGEVVYNITQTPQVWLDHQVSEQKGALVFNWDVVEGLFSEGLLHDMFDAYCCLLQRLASDEESWQKTWPEMAQETVPSAQLEQRAVINATGAPISAGMLHTLFAEQVFQRPLHPSVVSHNRTLTYEELDRRSNWVGYQLRQIGARPNTLVAVVMEKGWEQVVAVLGVLKSGAAYLPIDPGLPKERLCYLLEHGEVELILTQSWLNEEVEWPESVQRLCVDDKDVEGLPDQSLNPVQSPEDLAYVIYTSGSTGLPKGVMINHRGAVNTIVDINQRFGVGPNDRVLALSSLSFDLSVYDIFGTLAAGGTIVIPKTSTANDPAHWVELITEEKVTIWNSVPALMEMFVEYAANRPEVLPCFLRLVLLSGDWIPVTLPDQIKGLVEGIQVISLGGATEASIWSILYPIETVAPAWKSIPYGKPMVNHRFYVLNEALEPCPEWVSGMIYIAGDGLAKGYWRDEEKTRSSFFDHPRTGERLYRTGDLGRYLPDGNIEFLGRKDFQVKIQGFRIELGEIEAALAQYPGLRAAVVTAVGEPQGNKRLVAYIVPEQKQDATISEPQNLTNEKDHQGNHQQEGIPLDPLERLKFEQRQPGLRQESERPYIQLTKPELDETLREKYAERRSYRKFLQQPIPLEQFSRFLNCLLQLEFEGLLLPKYRYASAGSLYPVQTYLYIKPDRVEGVSAGGYYYHPKEHRLVLLSANAHIERSIHELTNQSIFDESAFSLFLIGQLSAITPLYGEASMHYVTLEAGLMCQMLEMSAPACDIGLCQIGSLDFERIRHLFVLEESHVFLHCLFGGGIAANEARFQALLGDAGEYRSFLQLLQQGPAKEKHSTTIGIASSSISPLVQQSKTDGIDMDTLRSFLKEKLPDYMMPSTFVTLDTLPLTPNGKVDRKALPSPDAIRSARRLEKTDSSTLLSELNLQSAYVAPRDELEQTMVDIWQELLGIKQVGIHDNFFELGGHSLIAVRLFVQIEQRLGENLPLVTLFQAPTIEQLASILRGREASSPWSPLVPIQPNGSKPPFFCVHGDSGEVIYYADLARHLGPEQPFYGIQAPGLDGKQPPYDRIEDMATRYVREIRALQPEGPYLLGGRCFGGIVAFEMAQQLQAQGQEVALLAFLDAPCPPIKLEDYIHHGLFYQEYLFSFVRFCVGHLRNLWRLSFAERLAYVLERARIAWRLFSVATHLRAHLPSDIYLSRLLEANRQAMRSYIPQAYLGRITLFLCSEPLVESSRDPRLGWAQLAPGGLEVHGVTGTQDDVLREAHTLAEKLRGCIHRALSIKSGKQLESALPSSDFSNGRFQR